MRLDIEKQLLEHRHLPPRMVVQRQQGEPDAGNTAKSQRSHAHDLDLQGVTDACKGGLSL
jgi:hypothetical protein